MTKMPASTKTLATRVAGTARPWHTERQDAAKDNRNLIVGTAWAAVLYFALYLIPVAVTAYLIPLVFLPLFGLTVVLKSRTHSKRIYAKLDIHKRQELIELVESFQPAEG